MSSERPSTLRHVVELIAGPAEREGEERVDAEPQAADGVAGDQAGSGAGAVPPMPVEAPADIAGQLDRVAAFDPVRFERLQERQRQGGEDDVLAATERRFVREIGHRSLKAREALVHDSADLRAREPAGGRIAAGAIAARYRPPRDPPHERLPGPQFSYQRGGDHRDGKRLRIAARTTHTPIVQLCKTNVQDDR